MLNANCVSTVLRDRCVRLETRSVLGRAQSAADDLVCSSNLLADKALLARSTSLGHTSTDIMHTATLL